MESLVSEDNDNIVAFPNAKEAIHEPVPRMNIICPVDNVFEGATMADLEQVVVVGLTKDKKFALFANPVHLADALMLLKRAEMVLVQTEHLEP